MHRLLGSRPGTRHFRHHAGNRLPLDVLVVDEASMIDLEMMANLLDAMPAHARLVLLGDKDQLASVEAGAVLGDLCRDAEAGWYSPQTRQWLESVSGESAAGQRFAGRHSTATHPLAQQVVMLRHSRRFGEGSGIGQLARGSISSNRMKRVSCWPPETTTMCFPCHSRVSTITSWSACCSKAMATDRKVIAIT